MGVWSELAAARMIEMAGTEMASIDMVSMEETATSEHESAAPAPRDCPNIVLLGASGAGKSTTGWLLARLIGYGFVDLDQMIERKLGKSVEQIFADDGESSFRALECELLGKLAGIRSHVVALGAGAVVDDEAWHLASGLGVTVWLNAPAEEIARRFLASEAELLKRPLLADVRDEVDPAARRRLLEARLSALIGNRVDRYKQADLVVTDSFSTPESTSQLLRSTLIREGYLSLATGQRPFDRWQIM